MTAPVAPRTSSLIRPAVALLAGLGIIVLIVGLGTLLATLVAMRATDMHHFQTPGYFLVIMVLTGAGAAAGGFATSRITSGRSFFTVFVLALLLFMSGVVPVLRGVTPVTGQPDWYPLVRAALSPIGVLIGGLIERWRSPVVPLEA